MKEFVIFKIKKESYAISTLKTNSIIEYEEPNVIPNAPEHVKGVINLRGSIVPVVDLREKLCYRDNVITDETRIIIVDNNGEYVGVIIDEVKSVSKIDEDCIEDSDKIGIGSASKAIEAVAKYDGTLVSILNIETALN